MSRRLPPKKAQDPLAEAILEISVSNPEILDKKEAEKEIVDIITFCNSPLYLDFLGPENRLKLFISQKIILKCFYMGTVGNETLQLTKEEWEWLYGNAENEELDGVLYERNIKDVIKKMLNKERQTSDEYFSVLHLVLGRRGTKCRYENDLIPTTEGSITYRNLCDRINNGEKIGICTYDTQTWKRSVTYDIKAKDNGKVNCFELETNTGIRETSSWNHPYLILRDNWEEPKFVQLKDLVEGDKIAIANSTELFGRGSVGGNKAAILGHLHSDSCTLSKVVIEDLKHLLLKEFPIQGDSSRGVKTWLEDIGCFKKENRHKKIPECILTGSKMEISMFLSRFFWRNGYFNPAMSFISYVSTSREMVDSIRHLLLKFGIHARIERQDVKDSKNYNWQLIVDNKECLEKFSEEIGFLLQKDYVPEPVNISDPNDIKIQSDIRWDFVKSVQKVGLRQTVDLEVNPHHIIGGDIISHNTLMASIITVYEAYKLLAINKGDPHGYYNLPSDDEIAIINVALSQQQAGRLFGQIQARIRNSPFFKGRVAKATTSEIRLFTDSDLRKKSTGVDIEVNGSVLLLCGHSNPDSLAGYSAILILFDEIAFYDESGKVTGTYFYNRLKPSLSKFYKYNAARIVMISSPNTRNGIFYDTAKLSESESSILSFQLPTWCANPDIPYNDPELTRDRIRNPDMFAIEYGAQWASGGTYGNYFEEGLIDRCIRGELTPHIRQVSGFYYYAHVDPANGGHNYSMVLVGKKHYRNSRGEMRWKVHLAGVWVWEPVPGIGLQFHEIDRDVIGICKHFRPTCVSYDDFQSVHSLQLLRSQGVNAIKIQFNRGIKQKIYMNLKLLMECQPEPELFLYDDGGYSSLLISEMKNIKFKRITRGISLLPDKNADVKTDDIVDCLAGACSMATNGIKPSLPMSVTVRTGFI